MTYHEYSPIVRILFVPKPSAKVPLLLQMLLAKCADTFYYGETSGELSYTIFDHSLSSMSSMRGTWSTLGLSLYLYIQCALCKRVSPYSS